MKYNPIQELYLQYTLIDIVICFKDILTKEEIESIMITLLVQIDYDKHSANGHGQ